MRFLHTADWHVGRTIRGRSRTDEFAAVLDELVGIATDESVDLVLLAGDIYDQRAVSADTDRLIFETLMRLGDGGITTVAIPGNHDSGARLAAFAPLLDRVGTKMVPRVLRPDSGGLVEVAARDGKSRALVACVPFVSPRRFAEAAGLFEDLAKGYTGYDEGMGKLLSAYEANFQDDAVNIVLGHLFVSGAKPAGSEREITIGSEYAVTAQRLPSTASYVALGHIHKAQKVPGGPGEARYAGSLLQLDFGEVDQQKSVVVAEASPGKPPKAKTIPLSSGRRLVDLDSTIDTIEADAKDVGDAYLRVNLHVDAPVPGIAERVRDALPNALDIRLVLPETEGAEVKETLRGLDPRKQFTAYYETIHTVAPPAQILDAFDRVYEEVTE